MMKYKTFFLACLMTACLVSGMSSFALAQYTFSLETTSDGVTPKDSFGQGEVLYVNIVLDDAGGVAGCAFTLEYPPDVLEAPPTSPDGTPVNIGDITSIFPFTYNGDDTHRENSSVPGKIYLAGAAIDTNDGGTLANPANVLFTIKFEVKPDAPLGVFDLSLVQTELLNTDAGWGIDSDQDGTKDTPEPVPVLVGAVAQGEAGWDNFDCSNPPCAFPVLLHTASPNDPPLQLAQASITVTEVETTPDSIDDAWEMTHFGGVNVADDTTDYDSDGYLDRYEQPPPAGNGTNPTAQDEPNFSDPKYDASTDDRGPYQVVATEPESPFAEANASFDMDVNYFTSDGVQNLSGFTLRIHYNSSILTWNSFSDVLPEGFTSQDGAPFDDSVVDLDDDPTTDSYLAVIWSGGNWPGGNYDCTQASPAKLYAVNFTVADGVEEGTTSTINFTAVPDLGYEFWGSPVEFTARAVEMGDVDGDGVVNVFDVIKIARASLGLPNSGDFYEVAADMDENGTINVFDVIKAARLSLGLD
jgi:hypothetical protein